MKFSVVVHKDTDGDYGVIVPDVPGCYSAGSTVTEALDNVKEALSLHFEGLIEDGARLSLPQAIDTHVGNVEFAGGIWEVVDFDVTPYLGKAARFNASLTAID
jgi:predicted RNase H-like HicB family nuclease